VYCGTEKSAVNFKVSSSVLKVCRYGPVRRTGTSVKVAAAYLYFHALASKPLLHVSAVQTKSSASTVAEATHTTL